jgi:ribosomal protein L30E
LLLIGDSETGKTRWARSLGHHAYFNLMFNLRDFEWDDSVKYIVIDDFPDEWETRWPTWKGLVGAQDKFVLTDKYMPKKTIHWKSRPCIICANNMPELKAKNMEYLRFRSIIVEIHDKVYADMGTLPPVEAPAPVVPVVVEPAAEPSASPPPLPPPLMVQQEYSQGEREGMVT